MDSLVVWVLCGLVIYLSVMNFIQGREGVRREELLLQKIMARDYNEYASHKARLERKEKIKPPGPVSSIDMNDILPIA